MFEQKQDFSNAKVGDKVFSIQEGWTEIVRISEGIEYPIMLQNDTAYTLDGKYVYTDQYPSLFAQHTVFPREMEVYIGFEDKWVKKQIIWVENGYAISSIGNSYKTYREIEDIKEYTQEELEAILGHKFRIK